MIVYNDGSHEHHPQGGGRCLINPQGSWIMQVGRWSWLVFGAAHPWRLVTSLQLLLEPGWGKNDLEPARHQFWRTPTGISIDINLSQKIISHTLTTTAPPQRTRTLLAVNPQKNKTNLTINYGIGQIVPQIKLHQHDRQATTYIQHEGTRSCQMGQFQKNWC